MRRIILTFVLIMSLVMAAIPVQGDGGVFVPPQAPTEDIAARENEQYAVIHYEDGIQYTYISIQFISSSDSVWIYPVHSRAEDVKVAIATSSITFSGMDIKEEAKYNLKNSFEEIISTMVFTPIFPVLMYPIAASGGSGEGAGGSSESGVTVTSRISEHGYTVEVVSGGGEGIYSHLHEHGFGISEGRIPQIDHYSKEGYSFVLAWFNQSSDERIRSPGIIIEHPAKEMEYPLVLTSVYGDRKVPATIIVSGFVTPHIYDDIKPYTKVKYYIGDCKTQELDNNVIHLIKLIHRAHSKRYRDETYIEYTYIHINSPANKLTSDLTIDSHTPMDVSLARFIHRDYLYDTCTPPFYISSVLIAALTGIFWGYLVIGRKRSEVPYFMTLGVAAVLGFMLLFSALPFIAMYRKWTGKEAIMLALGIFSTYTFLIVFQYFILFVMMG